MLPKQHRLPLRTEFSRVKKEGRLYQGKLFSLLIAKKDNRQPSRLTFIVSNKIHKKATQRNYFRRLLSEAILPFLPAIRPGFDGVFLVKKSIIGKNLSEIKKEVELVFKKTGLIADFRLR